MNYGLFGFAPGPANGAGQSAPIGAWGLFNSVAPLITLADGTSWLRSGSQVPIASASPLAARLDQLQNYGAPVASTGALSGNPLDIATNGSGTWVCGSSTVTGRVHYSTDNGASWSSFDTGASVYLRAVVWTGSRFVVAGNSTTAYVIYHSVAGTTTWTAATGLPAITATVEQVKLGATSAGVVLAVCDSTTAASSTDNGQTFTSRTLNGTPGAANPISPLYHSSSGLWLVPSGSGSYQTSPDLTTWTVRSTLTTTSFGRRSWVTNGTVIATANGFTSTDGINWTFRATLGSAGNAIAHNGSFFYQVRINSAGTTTPEVVFVSADAVTWAERNLVPVATAVNPPMFAVSPSGRLVLVANSLGFTHDVATPTLLGTGFAIGDPNAATRTQASYVRIR